MDDTTAIEVKGVSKIFKLPHEKNTSIKNAAVNFWRREKGYKVQKALKDVSFEVKKGEFFGVVGRNGSGKSTLLKLLAGIYVSDSGEISINGRLTPFIELGVGFNPELTGRENVFLNGALLGFNRKEMAAMYDKIVTFAELEEFMDQKLKNYSSGMQVRLAFSIAIRAQTNILILDEVLAVGDASFQQKCYDYFYELKRRKHTVVLVTHDMAAVRNFCSRGAVIDKGRVVKIGKPDEVAKEYERINLRNMERDLAETNNSQKAYLEHEGNGEATIASVETYNAKTRKRQNAFVAGEDIGVRLVFNAKKLIEAPTIGYIFQDPDNITVFATNNHTNKINIKNFDASSELIVESTVKNIFTNGRYSITCAIENDKASVIYDRIEHIHSFVIGGHDLPHATTHPSHTFSVAIKKGHND